MATKTTKENDEVVEEIVETKYSFTEDELEALIKKTTEDALKEYVSRTADPGITLGQNGTMNPAQLAAKSGIEVEIVDQKKSWLSTFWTGLKRNVSDHPLVSGGLAAVAVIAAKSIWDKNHMETDTDSITSPTDDNAFGGYMPQ